MDIGAKLVSFLGLFIMLGLAWAISENRKKFDLRLVLSGIGLQVFLGFLILGTPWGKSIFSASNDVVVKVIGFSQAGSEMLFGKNFAEHFFAFSVLPTIIFFSGLVAILFHLGLVQKVLQFFASIMHKLMKVSGAEALATSANIFVGGVESAILVKPYLPKMTRSELMALTTGGMATVAGGVMAAYVGMGIEAGHLLAASIMSAPASLVIAKIMVPETKTSVTMGTVKISVPRESENIIDAACKGASEGLKLVATIAAMLITFVALTTMLNAFLGVFPDVGGGPLSFERILGWVFRPIVFFTGATWEDSHTLGQLLGKKLFLNEFLAYIDLSQMKEQLQPRSVTLATYFLCGFANISSVAMNIGGLSSLCPSRRKEFAQLGIKCMVGGTLAALLTACVAGIFI